MVGVPVAAAVAGGIGLVALHLARGSGTEALERSAALTATERVLFSAAIEVMFPPGGALARSGTDAQILTHLGGFVARLGRTNRRLIGLLVVAIEWASLLVPAPGPGGRRRFSRQTENQRAASLEQLRTSPRYLERLMFTSLRALLTMGYFADPEVAAALGLAPAALRPHPSPADGLWPPLDGAGAAALRATESFDRGEAFPDRVVDGEMK